MRVTVNIASSNNVALEHLNIYLREANKSIIGSEYLHVRCATYILNLIVSAGLKGLDKSVARVRSAVRFVRFLLQRFDKFKIVVMTQI